MKESRGRVWTGVIRVGPRAGDHRVAVRAAIAVAVPLLVLWGVGRLDLSIYASFGAFAVLYGRADAFGDRMRMQLSAGGVLLACMLLGTSLSVAAVPALLSVLAIAGVAAAVTLLAYALRWHPPGGLFAVFAAGATTTIPATPATVLEVLAVGGAATLFALLVTFAFAVANARGLPTATRRRPMQPVGAVAWEMAATVGVAAVLAGVAGALLIGSHWYWAMVGAVAASGGAHVSARVIRGLQRLLGTLLGVLVAAGILALHLPTLAIIAIAVLLQAAAELYVGRNYGIAMVFITPLALLMVSLAAATPVELLLRDRVLETILGVAAGTLVAVASATLRRPRATRA
ncbi:FUSC family protein [Microbacterium sp. NPDC091313]